MARPIGKGIYSNYRDREVKGRQQLPLGNKESIVNVFGSRQSIFCSVGAGEQFPAILSTDKSVIVGALGTRHTARSSSVNTALGARNPLRKSTTLTSEARRSAQLKERARVNKTAALGYSERSKAHPQLPHFGIAVRKLNRTVSARLPLPSINRNLTNQRRQLKVGTVPAHPKRVILLKTASTSVPHPSTSKEDFRVWHKRLGKLGTKYLTGPNSCLYRYSLTLNGREKEESLSASEIGSAGTVWITCKLGVSLEVDCALVAERYEGRGRVSKVTLSLSVRESLGPVRPIGSEWTRVLSCLTEWISPARV
ncbi:hypothetical protein QYF36_009431 [Acer negundo]|nr:hypothetical protein QYF36_009431 [Acer negundo]